MRWFLSSSLLLSLASAGDISLLLFSDAQCSGNILTNVHSNPANEHSGSGCIATNTFQSAGAAIVDSGFLCNVYSDRACQQILTTIKSTDQCETLIGQSASCFSQASFDNPLANINAKVTVGSVVVRFTAEIRSADLVAEGVKAGCGDNGCDPNAQFKKDLLLVAGKNKCQIFASARGNYDNTAQRDYMSQLLGRAAAIAGSIDNSQVGGFGNVNSAPSTMPGFLQVVLEDATGNNKAQLEVTVTTNCAKASNSNGCDSFAADAVKLGLSQVPAVGGLLAAGFDAVCNVGS